jgi:hypothetical protein
MTPVIVPRVARLNSQSPASLGERNGSSSAIWKIAAVAVLALSWRAAEMALRRNRNRRKCTTKRSVSSMRTIEPVFESLVNPAVEQTAKTLRPSVPQTPEIAPALAAVPMPPEAARITEPSDEEIRLRAYFISEHRRRFALAGDEDSDWREAKQQLLSESGELSGLSTITTEAPSKIPARTEEIALPAVVMPAETDVGSIEPEQPVLEAAYRKGGPDGQLPPLAEPISESSAGLVVEQTPNGASPSAVPSKPHQMERRTEPSDQEIRLRAYFLSERRRRFALPGDADSDWREAKRQLLCESGELGGLSTITAVESGRILRAAADVALPVTVASAKPRVESIEQAKGMPCEMTSTEIQSSPAEAIPEPASNFSNAVSAEPVSPQTTTLPIMPDTTQIPTGPVDQSPSAVMPKTPPAGPAGTSVHVTFSFEITAVQLRPTLEMGVLTVRPASRLVTMRLALDLHSQPTKNLQVSFEAAKIQPVGGTLGTLRMLPSDQQRPVASGSRSFAPAGLQVVPNFEAAPGQLTPSQPAQATVFVTVPCEISILEFSPLFEIASVILNSRSKRVFVQLPGTRPGGEEGARVFEIANLEVTESGEISTMQLNLLDLVEVFSERS